MTFLDKYLSLSTSIGVSKVDSDELKLQKSYILLVPMIIAPLAIIWGSVYIFFGELLSGAIPLSYAIISFFNLLYFNKTKNITVLKNLQFVLVLFLPFFLMWSLGGFEYGSYVMIWAFYAPLAALVYEKELKTYYWFFSFLVLVVISSFINDWLLAHHANNLPNLVLDMFFFLNVSAGFSGIFFLVKFVIDKKDANANKALTREHKELLKTSEKLHKANLELENYAHYDSLTKLANRYYFQDMLSKKISYSNRYKKRFALLYIDLDGFKDVNDTYGHQIGDEILKVVAKRIKNLLREEDIVARIGGDEFTVILDIDDNPSCIEDVSKRIIDEINLDFDELSETSPLGASIGIGVFPDNAEDMESLISCADKAMYKVKKSFKNSYFTSSSLET